MDEFLKYQDKLDAGEDVSGYKFSGEVTQMPKQFNEWVKNNTSRLENAQSGDFVNIKEYTKLGYLEVLKVDKLIFNKSMICKILQII